MLASYVLLWFTQSVYIAKPNLINKQYFTSKNFKKINWLKFLDVDCFFNNILGHFISSWMLPIRSWHVFNVYDKYWAKRKFKYTTAIKFVIKFFPFNIRRVTRLNKHFHVIKQKHWTSKCLIASMKELIPQWKEGYHI